MLAAAVVIVSNLIKHGSTGANEANLATLMVNVAFVEKCWGNLRCNLILKQV